MLRNNSYRGGLACFGEIVWARVPGSRLLRGKYEVNWLELVWLGKTEITKEHLCGDEHGVRKFQTIRRQPESARWRREYVDKLSGDPFNPKPKTSMAVGPGELPVDLQWSTRASPKVNVDEAPGDRAQEPAATQKRWYVTEALVNEHGRTMGCPRCSSGIGIHNAECRAMIEGILLQQSRMKPAEVDEPRGGHTTTKSAPTELEKPTGPVHHGASSGSGIQRDDATRAGARDADARPLEATDVEMNAEDPCAAQVKRAKKIMGLEICVLEALDDVFDEPPETLTNLAGTPGDNETDEDVVSPEVTEELNRLTMLGRPHTAPSVDELMPRTFVYSQKTNEQLHKRMVAEGRERQLGALCSQNALFVIPRTALRPGTKMVRGRFVDGMKNGSVKSRFVAAEVARDVRHDVHAGTPALKALRMIVSLASTRDGKHRPSSTAFYDIVAAFVHASIDEVVEVVLQDGLLEKRECFLLLKALYGTRMASKRWQRHFMRVLRTHGWNANKVMPGFFHHTDPAGMCGCHGDDFMADRVMADEFGQYDGECQYAAKTVRSATREPTSLDWMRMMRLAKFLVSHSELEWIYQAQDVPVKYVVFGDSDWAGSEHDRSI